MNYFKHKAILIAITSTLVLNAHAELKKNNSDSVKPIATKTNVNSKIIASKMRDREQYAAKAKAKSNQVIKAKAKLDKQAQIILLLKNGQSCGSWFDASGSTGDAAAYEQIKTSGYTKYNAPEAIKKQIALGVANCDKKYLVEKPSNLAGFKAVSEEAKPLQAGDVDVVDNDTDGAKGFFARLIDSIINSGTSKPDCSPGARVMHSSDC